MNAPLDRSDFSARPFTTRAWFMAIGCCACGLVASQLLYRTDFAYVACVVVVPAVVGGLWNLGLGTRVVAMLEGAVVRLLMECEPRNRHP